MKDVVALLFYYLGYSRIRNSMLRLQHEPVLRCVTFHDILYHSADRFKNKMHFLKRRTNVVSFDDYFSGRLISDKINVIITFDDGFKSWVSIAAPVLKKLNLPATFFISSGLIDLSKKDEKEYIHANLLINQTSSSRITGCLNSEDVKKIAGEGFSVGGHTVNHCNLGEVQDRVKLHYEICEDKDRLERISGTKVEIFSYPFGVYHNEDLGIVEVLKKSGYKGAVTTVSGSNRKGSNPYFLNRELTRARMSGGLFRAIVYGNLDAVYFLKQFVNRDLRIT